MADAAGGGGGGGGGGAYPQLAKAFLTACRKGKLAEVTQLLEADSGSWAYRLLQQRDLDGYTGLHKAAYNGHLAVVTHLLAKGAPVAAETNDGWQPLHCAARWNQPQVAAALLDHGATVNAATHGGLTPLHIAAYQPDSLDVLLVLLQRGGGFDTSLRTAQGDTVRDILARGRHHQLLDQGFPALALP